MWRAIQEHPPDVANPSASPAIGSDNNSHASPTALGDAHDEFEIGSEHFELWRESQDAHHLDTAKHYLNRAQERGASAAYEPLGDIAAACGRPIEAVRWYRQAEAEGFSVDSEWGHLRASVVSMASAGDPEAQCEVGEWFLLGQGVEANAEEARSWFEKSAVAGFPLAKYRLAVVFYEGLGVPKDPSTGLLHLEAAAAAGQPDAQYKLASDILESSVLSPSDREFAVGLLESAVAQDHLSAIALLANQKLDVDDFAAAAPLLQRAAERGHSVAQYCLSLCYKKGEGVSQDDSIALYWLRSSASAGFRWAACALGQRYRDGEGLPADEGQAIEWLRKGAFGGDDEARLHLGYMLEARAREPDELAEAAFWFLRAAADGERPTRNYARYAFGYMCEHGRGIPQSSRLATKWYLLAAEAGVTEAGERLKEITVQNGEMLTGEDWMLAVERLLRASAQGVGSAKGALESLKRLDPRAAAYADLLNLVGMDEVKEAVRQFIVVTVVDRIRRDRGLPVASTSLHSVFFGPPGTGKTTVARILGRLLGSLGILSRGHVTEVDRAGLVGRYVGETAQKVDEVIQEALGGVLFIDEAYSLSRPLMTADFGGEAVDTLVKRMEDHRTDLVVIAAGYEEEMMTFLDSNPGLGSRFPWHFRFAHYSGPELLEVFLRLAAADGMTITPDCAERAGALFTGSAGRDRSFGNGRFARTVYEKARVHQASRLWQSGGLSREGNDQLQTLLSEDLPPAGSV